jgi:hypothetical protein
MVCINEPTFDIFLDFLSYRDGLVALRSSGLFSADDSFSSKQWCFCEGQKELAHTMVRLQLFLFSKKNWRISVSEHLVDFSTFLLHRFTASLAP